MAHMLFDKIKDLKGITITQKVESNGVFVIIPQKIAESLQKHYFFYPWDESRSEYRWMTSWDTTEEDIEKFVELLKREI
jgi:threonine aldolase